MRLTAVCSRAASDAASNSYPADSHVFARTSFLPARWIVFASPSGRPNHENRPFVLLGKGVLDRIAPDGGDVPSATGSRERQRETASIPERSGNSSQRTRSGVLTDTTPILSPLTSSELLRPQSQTLTLSGRPTVEPQACSGLW